MAAVSVQITKKPSTDTYYFSSFLSGTKINFSVQKPLSYTEIDLYNRPLSKPSAESKLRGDSERRTGVYTQVHEDSSTAATKQDTLAVKFPKKSNVDSSWDTRNIEIVDLSTIDN